MPGNKYDRLDTKHISEGRYDEVIRQRAAYNDSTGQSPPFKRMVVLEVISDPSTLDRTKLSHLEHDLGVSNIAYAAVAPRNSIVARRVMASDSGASEKVMVLYPFFPSHMSLPAKVGEHVWAMFENPDAKVNDLGYWMCRISQPAFVDDVNYTHADRQFDPSFSPSLVDSFEGNDNPSYGFPNGATDKKDGMRYPIPGTASLPNDEKAYEKLLTTTDASRLTKYEPVPRYRKRPADIALEGSNNALIVLGTDRTGPVAEYDIDPEQGKVPRAPDEEATGEGTGSIDIVVGRGQTSDTSGKAEDNLLGRELGKAKKDLVEREGDVDYKNDRSRINVAQRTRVDKNLKVDVVVKAHSADKVTDTGSGEGAIVVKSDKVRLVARHDVVILVTGASETDENGNVKDPDPDPDTCASVIIKVNGDIVFTPAKKGLIRLGGEDADLVPLCTRINDRGPGGQVTAQPIIDTSGGAQGASDGLNGAFPRKILMK